MIEDYFFINDDLINLVEDTEMTLGSFCVEGPDTVINFALTATLDSGFPDGIT